MELQKSNGVGEKKSLKEKADAERQYKLAGLRMRAGYFGKAVNILRNAAEMGSWRAQFALCQRKLADHDLSNEVDASESRTNGEKALKNIDKDTQDKEDIGKLLFSLANICHTAEGEACDYERALELYRKCGDLGNLNALNSYGVMLRDGEQVEKDEKKGMEAIQQAADRGCSVACFNVGMAFLKGMYTYSQDTNVAHQWFKKCWQYKSDGMLNEFHLQFVERSVNDWSYLQTMVKNSVVCAVPKNSAGIVGGICTVNPFSVTGISNYYEVEHR
eukprot:UN25600